MGCQELENRTNNNHSESTSQLVSLAQELSNVKLDFINNTPNVHSSPNESQVNEFTLKCQEIYDRFLSHKQECRNMIRCLSERLNSSAATFDIVKQLNLLSEDFEEFKRCLLERTRTWSNP